MLACIIIMGHYTSGFKTSNKENEIATLFRSAIDELNITIYNALVCHEYDSIVSGNGNGRVFTRNQLINALDYLSTKEDVEREYTFLTDCLANIDKEGKVLIVFN